ncbi:hypothetical protein [Aliiruegeria sabulilitoris]|uniref:hypothetical protein n=1 Tax=Aliiruegeria sabulilitoris TaxID=1510458 RepID=UPI000A9C55C2|nr:hypothetical protein [Aliiruegeria sabulilitoris]
MGCTHADVMIEAHRIRVARGDYTILEVQLADAIELLVGRRLQTLSESRAAGDPYRRG